MPENPVPGYGDLSEKDLLEFLHAIECEDEALQNEADKVDQAELEEQSWFESLKEQESQATTEYIKTASPSQKSADMRKIHSERRLLKTRIQRAAFDQSEIPLTQKLTNEDIKTLIEVLTEDQVALVNRYSDYVTARVKALLLPFIPSALKRAFREFPHAVKACPGFLYRASAEYGESKVFFVKPDVPYYFPQGTEMSVLRGGRPDFICAVDRAVLKYHQSRERLFNKETSIASAMPKYGITTYFHLLNHNVIWFSKLYLKKTGKPLKLVD